MHKLEKYSAIAGLDKVFGNQLKFMKIKITKKRKNIILCTMVQHMKNLIKDGPQNIL